MTGLAEYEKEAWVEEDKTGLIGDGTCGFAESNMVPHAGQVHAIRRQMRARAPAAPRRATRTSRRAPGYSTAAGVSRRGVGGNYG